MAKTFDEIMASLEKEDQEILTKHLDSERDRMATKGIETYKKLHPDANGLADRIARLAEAHEKYKADTELKYSIYRAAVEAHIDPDLLEGFKFENIKQAEKKIAQLKQNKEDIARAEANILAAGSVKPGSGNSASDPKRMSAQEKFEYYKRQAERRG